MKYIAVSFILLLSGGGLWLNGCGRQGLSSGVFASKSSDEASGVFASRSGRLSSDDDCSDSEDCKEMCNSMLRGLSDQAECYKLSEKEVQSLRDTYNLLAIGSERKLGQITPDDMEDFLDFGPELWHDAIMGFERGQEDDDDHYVQRGYDRQGAANALSWIARNNYLGSRLLKQDKNNIVMKALLSTLVQPNILPSYSDAIKKAFEKTGSTAKYPNEQCRTDVTEGHFPAQPSSSGEVRAFFARCLHKGKSFWELVQAEDNKDSIKLSRDAFKDICTGSCTQTIIETIACSVPVTANYVKDYLCSREAELAYDTEVERIAECEKIKTEFEKVCPDTDFDDCPASSGILSSCP